MTSSSSSRRIALSFLGPCLWLSLPACAELLDGDRDHYLSSGGSAAGSGGTGGSTVSAGGTGGLTTGGTGTQGGTGGATTSTTSGCAPNELPCDGTCVDVMSNNNNCGFCGHSCPQSACAEGLCEVQELVTGVAQPAGIAVDQTHVYFTTSAGTVQRVPRNGGAVSTLASGLGALGSVAVVSPHVYFANLEIKAPQRMSKNGAGQVETLAPSQPSLGQVTASANGVFFTVPTNGQGDGDGSVGQVDLAGGAVTWLATALMRPDAVAVTASKVYFSQAFFDAGQNKYTDGSVSRVAIGGGATESVATGEIVPKAIVAEAGGAYWGNAGADQIRKRVFAESDAATLAIAQDEPYGVAIDDTRVYWTTYADGTVMCADKAGGNLRTVATGRVKPLGLAVDDTHVYWIDSGEAGKVLRVPK